VKVVGHSINAFIDHSDEEVKPVILDAVLDEHYRPIYNEPRSAVIAWLKENPEINRPKYSVLPGDFLKFMSVSEYLERYDV
jgi:hypothetical protein